MSTSNAPDGEESVRAAFNSAEEIRDPFGGLVDQTSKDPGAPFATEVLQRLIALKREDRAAFEALRAQLKKAGCDVKALNKAMLDKSGRAGRHEPTQADILIALAETAELFHAPDGTAFADIHIKGHRETRPIRRKDFRRWLARCFFEATGGRRVRRRCNLRST